MGKIKSQLDNLQIRGRGRRLKLKMEKFDQGDVCANHVLIYRQIGMIYELSGYILRYTPFRIRRKNYDGDRLKE